MQEKNRPVNEEKLLKKVKREAPETIERVENGLYEKVYSYRKQEIEKFYADENETIAKNAALRLLEEIKEEDMAKYAKAKNFIKSLSRQNKQKTNFVAIKS